MRYDIPLQKQTEQMQQELGGLELVGMQPLQQLPHHPILLMRQMVIEMRQPNYQPRVVMGYVSIL